MQYGKQAGSRPREKINTYLLETDCPSEQAIAVLVVRWHILRTEFPLFFLGVTLFGSEL
ncbi:hypothetical protein [Terriglobus albidus]|uniref:hypothetical protein n=1 Tax=Terriglobus albidus TaxID=1592106 RepID=UPI00164EB17E|nr:hypothetical protein [Terriglobus albidus]